MPDEPHEDSTASTPHARQDDGATTHAGQLAEHERAAWEALSVLLTRLPAALDHEMLQAAELSYYDFTVLATLKAAPEQTLRVGELAALTDSSLSRMSHTMRRLEQLWLVVREQSPTDRRATLAVLTTAGAALYDRLAPRVTALVRDVVVDALDDDGLHGLLHSAGSINERLATAATTGPPRRGYRRSGREGRASRPA